MDRENLIIDYIPFKVSPEIITESKKKNDGKIIVTGILQTADKVNQNNRLYRKKLLERELEKYNQYIKERRALGELDHPDSAVINLKNVSHLILEAHWEGNNIVGTIEILDTPSGNILKNLIESGVSLGISSRGMGSVNVEKNGVHIVQDDFELIAWDFVSNPSTHGAFMRPVTNITEAIDYYARYDSREKIDELIRDVLINLSE